MDPVADYADYAAVRVELHADLAAEVAQYKLSHTYGMVYGGPARPTPLQYGCTPNQ